MISQKIANKEAKMALIGLGYVGLPIALEFARKAKVVGFDINQARVDLMRKNIDPSNELEAKDFEGCDIHFSADLNDLKDVNFFIVAVPTPIDQHNLPDLKPLLSASKTVGKVLKKGDYVVFESTVYPGCTEEDCVPVLEQESGLKFGVDFKVGYSPERINPGDKEHTLAKIVKVVSGSDKESAAEIAKVYGMVITAGIHQASSIKVAEAAKIIENTQRDVNIALMNELSLIFSKMNINTYEVLEAAGTKWNFLKFSPGLVGGHCIGVDPYYLTYKAEELGIHAKIITSGRAINDAMGAHLARLAVKKMVANGKDLAKARVLIMGTTFKENVTDTRNSKVADVVNELKSFAVNLEVHDPHADAHEILEEYGYDLVPEITGKYDAIIVAVNHREYVGLGDDFFGKHFNNRGVLVDVKGIYRNKVTIADYISF